MGDLFIESYSPDSEQYLKVSLETFVSLVVYKTCNSNKINLKVVSTQRAHHNVAILVDKAQIQFDAVDEVPKIATRSVWPVFVVENTAVVGLAAVARQMIRRANSGLESLLGFRGACLIAPSETSIWTRFCEVDIISTVNNGLLSNFDQFGFNNEMHIPRDFVRFENHLKQPVRMHNVYKIARIKNNNKLIQSNVPLDQLNIAHVYSEGPFMTLADLILFPCYGIVFETVDIRLFDDVIPLTVSWFRNLKLQETIWPLKFKLEGVNFLPKQNLKVVISETEETSLYKSDIKRCNPGKWIFTSQLEINDSLNIISNSQLSIVNDHKPYGHEQEFAWSSIPEAATPNEGVLPHKRVDRKSQQLENFVKAVKKIAGQSQKVIVDFCSGSGHLGIVIACLLPKCHVILVENKELSLLRAKERVKILELDNVSLLQCNLNYFNTGFDIGMSLHACGVATDLVIQKCIKHKADFVCCPCCYGSINNCQHVSYPKSEVFRASPLTYRDYLVICHAADQTHDDANEKTAQGYVCMDIIDWDRKMQAEECDYEVHLGKLVPVSCTPKNNLLVGLLKANQIEEVL